MTVHLNYKDSLNKYNRQKIYVARSRNKDVLVSTLSTANLYTNKSKSGVTIPSGGETKCRDYSITQVHGKGSTKGRLCVEIQSKVAKTYAIHTSTDEIIDGHLQTKRKMEFQLSIDSGKCSVELNSVSTSSVSVGSPDNWVSGSDLRGDCNVSPS